MVARAVYNWGLWLANIARRGEKPWDQTTFAPAMEWVSSEVTVRHLTMVGRGSPRAGGRGRAVFRRGRASQGWGCPLRSP